MTELLPKPKRSEYKFSGGQQQFDSDERDYYKRLAEFAINEMEWAKRALEKDKPIEGLGYINKALSTIKQSEL